MRINNERFTDGWAFHKLSISWKFYRRWINIPVIPPVTIFFSISREICEIRIPARCSTDIRLVWKALANSTKHHDAKFEGTHSRIAVFHETSHRAWNFSSELYYRRFTWFRLFRCDAGTRTEIESAGAAKVKKIAGLCNIDFHDECRRPWCLVAIRMLPWRPSLFSN